MSEAAEQKDDMKRELKLLDATMLVAGSMIGSGIFIVSSDKFTWPGLIIVLLVSRYITYGIKKRVGDWTTPQKVSNFLGALQIEAAFVCLMTFRFLSSSG